MCKDIRINTDFGILVWEKSNNEQCDIVVFQMCILQLNNVCRIRPNESSVNSKSELSYSSHWEFGLVFVEYSFPLIKTLLAPLRNPFVCFYKYQLGNKKKKSKGKKRKKKKHDVIKAKPPVVMVTHLSL